MNAIAVSTKPTKPAWIAGVDSYVVSALLCMIQLVSTHILLLIAVESQCAPHFRSHECRVARDRNQQDALSRALH
jgi:hypothetical protein